MDQFVHRENIRLCERLLDAETDPKKRSSIQRLLQEEHEKDEILGADPLGRRDEERPDA